MCHYQFLGNSKLPLQSQEAEKRIFKKRYHSELSTLTPKKSFDLETRDKTLQYEHSINLDKDGLSCCCW